MDDFAILRHHQIKATAASKYKIWDSKITVWNKWNRMVKERLLTTAGKLLLEKSCLLNSWVCRTWLYICIDIFNKHLRIPCADKNCVTAVLTVFKRNQWGSLCRKVWCYFLVWIHMVDYSSGTESMGENDF